MIALIDADSICFSSCFKDGEEVTDLDIAIDSFNKKLFNITSKIEEDLECELSQVYIFVGSKGNFRRTLFPEYKANRTSYPIILRELSNQVAEMYDGFVSYGVESDDSVASSWKYFSDLYGRDNVVIASIDKDLKQIPCLFFDYYYTRMEVFNISEKEAFLNFFKQMLIGDSSDNVKGVKGIGKVGAERILKRCNSYVESMLKVYRIYIQAYGEYRGRKLFVSSYTLLKLRTNCETPKLF